MKCTDVHYRNEFGHDKQSRDVCMRSCALLQGWSLWWVFHHHSLSRGWRLDLLDKRSWTLAMPRKACHWRYRHIRSRASIIRCQGLEEERNKSWWDHCLMRSADSCLRDKIFARSITATSYYESQIHVVNVAMWLARRPCNTCWNRMDFLRMPGSHGQLLCRRSMVISNNATTMLCDLTCLFMLSLQSSSSSNNDPTVSSITLIPSMPWVFSDKT